MFQVNDPFKRTIMRQSSWSSGCFYSHCDSRSSVWTCPHADLSKQKRSDFTLKSLLLRKKNKARSIARTCPLEAIKCHHDQWKVPRDLCLSGSYYVAYRGLCLLYQHFRFCMCKFSAHPCDAWQPALVFSGLLFISFSCNKICYCKCTVINYKWQHTVAFQSLGSVWFLMFLTEVASVHQSCI